MNDYTTLVFDAESLRGLASTLVFNAKSLTAYGPEVSKQMVRALAGVLSALALLDELDTDSESCPVCNGDAYHFSPYVDEFEPCPLCLAKHDRQEKTVISPPIWATEIIPLQAYEVQV